MQASTLSILLVTHPLHLIFIPHADARAPCVLAIFRVTLSIKCLNGFSHLLYDYQQCIYWYNEDSISMVSGVFMFLPPNIFS